MVNQEFSWESFSKPEQKNIEPVGIKQQKPIQKQEQKTDFSWGEFKTPDTYQGEPSLNADESTLSWLLRNRISADLRIAEKFGGRYGDIEEVGRTFLKNVPTTFGIMGEVVKDFIGSKNWDKIVSSIPVGGFSELAYEKFHGPRERKTILPTSKELKSITEKLTGEYTKPKTEWEKKFQGLSEDIGTTLTRIPTGPRDVLINNLAIPLTARATEEIVKDLGFGEDKASIAKMLVWLPLTLAGNINAPQYAAQITNQGRNGFGPQVVANVPRLQRRMVQAGRPILQNDPRSALARQQLQGVQEDISNGQITMQDLMTRYDAINAAKRSRGLFELSREDRRYAINSINRVLAGIRNEIRQIGRNSNPQALQQWENGIRSWSVIHRSRALTQAADNFFKGPYGKLSASPLAALFGIATYKGPLLSPTLAAASGAAYKSGQVMYRVFSDPNLSRYYWNSIGALSRDNAQQFINNFQKMNDYYEKKYGKEKKSIPPMK